MTEPDVISAAVDKPNLPLRTAGRTNDPERVRRNILDIAREEFVANGLSGARVDNIAARTDTSKRMIYYYFTDKLGLYLAVLEEAYAQIRGIEKEIALEALPAQEAMRRLIGLTFDFHARNPDFVRLVMIENIHFGRNLKTSDKVRNLNRTAISTLKSIYERGVKTHEFRSGIDPFDIHLTISALSFYNVSNRSSIHVLFEHDMGSADMLKHRRAIVTDTVMMYINA